MQHDTHLPKTGKHNVKRAMRMRTRPVKDLVDTVKRGSLSTAAAMFELERRDLEHLILLA